MDTRNDGFYTQAPIYHGVPQATQNVQQPLPQAVQQQATQNVQQQVTQQQAVQEPPKEGTRILSKEEVNQIVCQLKPVQMTNPVEITEPSVVLTKSQLQYILSLAKANPQQIPDQTPFVQPQVIPSQCGQPIQQAGNLIDGVANATLGTVGRVGHTLTGLVDSILDIFTLGYGKR